LLSSDDFGKDLGSVQTLQRKHDGLERDLAALEDKVQTLGESLQAAASLLRSSSYLAAQISFTYFIVTLSFIGQILI